MSQSIWKLAALAVVLSAGKTSRLHHRLIEEDGTGVSVQSNNSTGRYPGWVSIEAELFKADEMGKVAGGLGLGIKLPGMP